MLNGSNNGSSKPRKDSKLVSDAQNAQISVLSALGKEVTPATPRPYQINEIAEISGVRDEREIQRHLFILEGQKLVSPHPEGDFTSKTWYITKTGIRALKTIQRANLQ